MRRTAVDIEPLRPEHAPRLWAALQSPAIYAFLPESPPVSVERLRGRYAPTEQGRDVVYERAV